MPLEIQNINETFAYKTSNNIGSASASSSQTRDTTGANENPASKDLEALRNYCFNPLGKEKRGSLRLVKN
jgi:hypothetical protein